MQFSFVAIIASVAALVVAAPQPRQTSLAGCAEAAQYGLLSVSPTTIAPGEILTVTADFNCAINYFGIHPEFTDYYIEVPVNNNGHEPPILLSRGAFPGTTNVTFTVTLPDAYYFANTSYTVMLETTYPINGPNGMPYSIVGGVGAAITVLV